MNTIPHEKYGHGSSMLSCCYAAGETCINKIQDPKQASNMATKATEMYANSDAQES